MVVIDPKSDVVQSQAKGLRPLVKLLNEKGEEVKRCW